MLDSSVPSVYSVDTLFAKIVRLALSCFLLASVSLAAHAEEDGEGPLVLHAPRVLILTGNGGNGTASDAIASDLEAQIPGVQVTVTKFYDLLPGYKAWIYEKAYPWFVRKMPGAINYMFNRTVQKSPEGKNISNRPLWINNAPEKIAAYIESVNPDIVISTHYGVTEALASLREKGQLKNRVLAWEHTDLVDSPFYSELAKKMDMTFLPHSKVSSEFIKHGVDPKKLMVTGISIPREMRKRQTWQDRREARARLGIGADVKTFVIQGGAQGAMPYDEIVKSLIGYFGDEPMVIVALCEKNLMAQAKLKTLHLPVTLNLQIKGMVSQAELIEFQKAADALIIKPGALSAYEAMYVEKEVVTFDQLGAEDEINATFMDKMGVADRAWSVSMVGESLAYALSEYRHVAYMVRAQRELQEQMKPEQVAIWAATKVEAKAAKAMKPKAAPRCKDVVIK